MRDEQRAAIEHVCTSVLTWCTRNSHVMEDAAPSTRAAPLQAALTEAHLPHAPVPTHTGSTTYTPAGAIHADTMDEEEDVLELGDEDDDDGAAHAARGGGRYFKRARMSAAVTSAVAAAAGDGDDAPWDAARCDAMCAALGSAHTLAPLHPRAQRVLPDTIIDACAHVVGTCMATPWSDGNPSPLLSSMADALQRGGHGHTIALPSLLPALPLSSSMELAASRRAVSFRFRVADGNHGATATAAVVGAHADVLQRMAREAATSTSTVAVDVVPVGSSKEDVPAVTAAVSEDAVPFSQVQAPSTAPAPSASFTSFGTAPTAGLLTVAAPEDDDEFPDLVDAPPDVMVGGSMLSR